MNKYEVDEGTPIPKDILTQPEANELNAELKGKMTYNGMGTDFTCVKGVRSVSKKA